MVRHEVPTGKYERLKDYPNVPMRALEAGAFAVGFLAFSHGFPDLIHSTFLHNLPIIEGLSSVGDHAVNFLSHGTVGLIDKVVPNVPGSAHALFNTGAAHDVLAHIPDGARLFTPDSLVLGEAATVVGGITSATHWLRTKARKPELVDAPSQDKIEAAQRVIARLNRRGFRYRHLNATEVAVDIEAITNDLKKGEIRKSAFYASTLGEAIAPVLRHIISAETAARITLRKEIFKRMKGTLFHRLWSVTDSAPAELLKKVPAVGDGFNAVTDAADYVVGLVPKRDIFGKFHFGVESIGINLLASFLGDVVDVIPFFTSTDVKELVEVIGRPALQSEALNPEVVHAATVIVGDRVRRSPHRYSTQPKMK